jgi:hypothetical protein
VNWDDILKTVGSTAVIVTALGFVAKAIVGQVLRRDIETHKSTLYRDASQELADAKANVDRELAAFQARTQTALQTQKVQFDEQMETFKRTLDTRFARDDRIRQEVMRWANPILGAVTHLHRRLQDILHDRGYLALSPEYRKNVNPEWSITYDYFFVSTLYLLGRYFCWIRVLEEKLSFEMFERHEAKDAFFDKVRVVGRMLSAFPLKELRGVSGTGDRQVFTLQQQALGETMAVLDGDELRCMRYSEFLEKWSEVPFRRTFEPLEHFIDRLEPTDTLRWKRLALMTDALETLKLECERLLKLNSDAP